MQYNYSGSERDILLLRRALAGSGNENRAIVTLSKVLHYELRRLGIE